MDAYQLPKASEEQKTAIRHLIDGNVVIESVAGSGKTTTVLYIAKVFAKRNILLLTYNAKLKMETREKVSKLGITNLEVHSYHSFCVKYIDTGCTTDAGIIRYLRAPPQQEFWDMPAIPTYDLIVIDEAQDMTFVYYELVQKILEVSPKAYICVLGDQFQSIYGFNNADRRFITLADSVFTNVYKWGQSRLSTSYRITNQMANFINQCAFGYEHMHAAKNGTRPRYLFADQTQVTVLEEVKYYLTNRPGFTNYNVEDIFILAPSVRGGPKSPINRLSNLLSKCGYPVYMPNDDDRKLDDEVLRGKLVFSTYHQAKGLERKVVIVMGFDMSYYIYFNKRVALDTCPNEVYVAITRASEKLTIVHGHASDFLPFLRVEKIPETCEVIGDIGIPHNNLNEDRGVRVTDLIRHVSPTVMSILMNLVSVETIIPPGDIINIPTKTAQENPLGDVLYEEVSDITGTAVPAYYQYMISGGANMDIFRALPAHLRRALKFPILSPEHLLEIANHYNSMRSNLVFKVNQIRKYDWLTNENLELCLVRLMEHLPVDAKMETGFKMEISGKLISGYVDAIATKEKVLWEIKCVQELTDEHILQLSIYALMHQLATGEVFTYNLYNVATGELRQIRAEKGNLIKLVRVLVHYKYHIMSELNDVEFLTTTAKIRGGIIEKKSIVCNLCTTWREHPPNCTEIIANKPLPAKKRIIKRKIVRK